MNFKDISWNVSEYEYRKDPALSYSMLAKYEREGFDGIKTLFDRVETPSLSFGSAVDSIITGGMEEFNERFYISELVEVNDVLLKCCRFIYDDFKGFSSDFSNIPNEYIVDVLDRFGWNRHWREDTRLKVFKENAIECYRELCNANGRELITKGVWQDVEKTVKALKTSKATARYFADNVKDSHIQRYYQLKFKSEYDGVAYRNMADLIVVDYREKTIIPIDLKTSSKAEWNFHKSFLEWRYDIQARLYWRIIRDNMDKSEFFKDFKLKDYKFIVVNKNTLTPLVWEFDKTTDVGELKIGKHTLRDPYVIGKELDWYLQDGNSEAPNGINIDGVNTLSLWIEKY